MRITIVTAACLTLALSQAAHAQQQYTPYPIPGGIKVCSAVVPGNWRNDLPVPRSWTKDTCVNWSQKIILASGTNLACLRDDGMHYDTSGGNWNTCGW